MWAQLVVAYKEFWLRLCKATWPTQDSTKLYSSKSQLINRP